MADTHPTTSSPRCARTRLPIAAAYMLALMLPALADPPPGPQLPPLNRDHIHNDGSDWIRQGKHLNEKGESCCGVHDCTAIDGSGIATTPSGYFIRGLQETVPYSETKRSEDGKYWRCQWGGQRKCFFAPASSI